jgi:hypothetical protein
MACVTEGGSTRGFSVLLGYVSISEEANMKLAELVEEDPVFYDWSDIGYSRNGKKWTSVCLCEDIGKELKELT